MEKPTPTKYSIILCVILAILTAMVLRQIKADIPMNRFARILRASIYIGMFASWGISIYIRIIQPQVRRYLIAISSLMVFWIIIRTIRYSLNDCVWLMRYLWYLYYLPMLLIPLLGVFVALSLGKAENFRLPKWTILFYIPTIALLLLVLTNDLHQLVFTFPTDAVVWMNDYHHAIGYFLIVIWMIFCAVEALAIMLIQCRSQHSLEALLLPFVPVLLSVVYCALWIFRVLGIFQLAWLKAFAGDMTVVFCLLFTAVLESCIQCGLIQSNTGYDELFMVSRLGAQITDQENRVHLASLNARKLTEEQKIRVETQRVLADKSMLIRSQPIKFGHVLWQEDIGELTEAIEQIEENCRDLAEHNGIRRENLETRKKILALHEKNRVNDLIHRETAGQIDLIDQLLVQYDRETDTCNRSRLLAGAAVAGAYIKRFGNLLLVSECMKTANIQDLSRCFDESFMNMELLGINCLHTLPSGIFMETKDMIKVYSSFETIVESCLYDLSHVWIHMRNSGNRIFLHMEFVCDTDLSRLAQITDAFTCEEETYRFTFDLKQKAGEEE